MKRVLFLQGAVLLGVAVATASCTQGLPSQGTYDAVLPNNTVITLRLERMDNGKVEGSIQGTAVNTATNTVVNLPVSELRGEVFHVRLPASAVGGELSQREITFLDDQSGLIAFGEEFGLNHRLVFLPGIQGEDQATRRLALVQPTSTLPTTGEAGP